jgi:hypothetical protein
MPNPFHTQMTARAASAGMSLSDYLLKETHRMAERPTLDVLLARLSSRSKVTTSVTSAEAVRAERDMMER